MTGSIILDVCQEHRVHPVEFFGNGRDQRLVRVRRIAIARLVDAEFNMVQIAAIMRRNYTTVRYWMIPRFRKYRKQYARDYQTKKRAA